MADTKLARETLENRGKNAPRWLPTYQPLHVANVPTTHDGVSTCAAYRTQILDTLDAKNQIMSQRSHATS